MNKQETVLVDASITNYAYKNGGVNCSNFRDKASTGKRIVLVERPASWFLCPQTVKTDKRHCSYIPPKIFNGIVAFNAV